jgi:hypothetical protein
VPLPRPPTGLLRAVAVSLLAMASFELTYARIMKLSPQLSTSQERQGSEPRKNPDYGVLTAELDHSLTETLGANGEARQSTDFLFLSAAAATALKQRDYPRALAFDQRIIDLCISNGQLSEMCASDRSLDLQEAFRQRTETLVLLGRLDEAATDALGLMTAVGRSEVSPRAFELSAQWSGKLNSLAASLDVNGSSTAASLLRLNAARMVGRRLRFIAQTASDPSLSDLNPSMSDLVEQTAKQFLVYGSSPDARQLFMDLLAIWLKHARGSHAELFSTDALELFSQVKALVQTYADANALHLVFQKREGG